MYNLHCIYTIFTFQFPLMDSYIWPRAVRAGLSNSDLFFNDSGFLILLSVRHFSFFFLSQVDRTALIWPHIVLYSPLHGIHFFPEAKMWPLMVPIGPYWICMIPYGPVLSGMALHGPTR